MIVDTSALVAVLFAEPDARALLRAMAGADRARIPTPALLEAGMVATRLGPTGGLTLDALVRRVDAETVDFTGAHATRAMQALTAYGRGSGHPARLNFGDCMVYAVASVEDEPLLFKGDDFTHTDLVAAVPG